MIYWGTIFAIPLVVRVEGGFPPEAPCRRYRKAATNLADHSNKAKGGTSENDCALLSKGFEEWKGVFR